MDAREDRRAVSPMHAASNFSGKTKRSSRFDPMGRSGPAVSPLCAASRIVEVCAEETGKESKAVEDVEAAKGIADAAVEESRGTGAEPEDRGASLVLSLIHI